MLEGPKKKVEDIVSNSVSNTISETWKTVKPIAKEAAIGALSFKAAWIFLDLFKRRSTNTHFYYHIK